MSRVGPASCGSVYATDAREAPGETRPSATTSGTREFANVRPKGTAHVHRPTVSPRRARGQQSPKWSAERRASPLGCKASADACGPTSLARRRVPLHPSAFRRSAPSPCVRGTMASLGGALPREKENACLHMADRGQGRRTPHAKCPGFHPGIGARDCASRDFSAASAR